MRRTICLSGIDEALFEANEKYIDAIFPNDHDWMVYAQYAAVIFPTSIYCYTIQSSKVVLHLELVWYISCLEGLSRPYFAMGKHFSKAVGNGGADLTNPQMNQFVKKTMFEFDEEHEAFDSRFENTHNMLDDIELAQRATYCLLGVILGIFERNRGSTKAHNTVLDENITSSLMAGLSHSNKLP